MYFRKKKTISDWNSCLIDCEQTMSYNGEYRNSWGIKYVDYRSKTRTRGKKLHIDTLRIKQKLNDE